MSQPRERDRLRRLRGDLDWVGCLERAFVLAMGEPSVAGRAKPEVRVLAANKGGNRFEIELRFRSGERYCCAESACFLRLESRRWWTRLREAIDEMTDRRPPPMSVLVRGVVEQGAILEGLVEFGLSARSEAYAYEEPLVHEADAG